MNVHEQFLEKNQELLITKLKLSINNNSDSFNLTLDNFIELKSAALKKIIDEVLRVANIDSNKSEIDEEIDLKKVELKELIIEELLNRKNKLNEFLEAEEKRYDEKKIEDFKKKLDDVEIEFNSSLEGKVNEKLLTELSSNILSKVEIPEPDTVQSLRSKVKVVLNDPLINASKEGMALRTRVLKNEVDASYKHFLVMNELTVKQPELFESLDKDDNQEEKRLKVDLSSGNIAKKWRGKYGKILYNNCNTLYFGKTSYW